MDDQGFIKIGPGGVVCGSLWDEKGHSDIVQIFISHDQEKICSIQFQYLENGTLVLSNLHGKLSNIKFDVIEFKYPEEYVTSISGVHVESRNYNGISYNYINNGTYLSSLSIGTNLRKYGPFGRIYNIGYKEFHYSLGIGRRQFGGFYGSGYSCVSSIGVYFKPLITHQETINDNNSSNNNNNNSSSSSSSSSNNNNNSSSSNNNNNNRPVKGEHFVSSNFKGPFPSFSMICLPDYDLQ